MNLVVDDAIEVQLATRDAPEKRRQLGKNSIRALKKNLTLILFQDKFY